MAKKGYNEQGTLIQGNKKAPHEGLLCGLWEIRTLDLFRVKEAL